MGCGAELPILIGGPYAMPLCKIGDDLAGAIVRGITDAPIQWPYTLRGHQRSLLLTGDLVAAVRVETVVAVAAWFGVGRTTVRIWRRSLGVPRFNPGTSAVWKRSAGRLRAGEARRRKRA